MIKPLLTALMLSASAGLFYAPVAAAGTVIESEDWLVGDEAAQALEMARERGLPVVLMMTARETTCPLCVNASVDIISARPHKDMVRIMYYTDAAGLNSTEVNAFAQQAGRNIGVMRSFSAYYLTAEGQPLGFVPYGETTSAREEGGTVLQIHEWISSVPRAVERADAQAERGRYAEAVRAIETVASRDAQVSHMIQQLLGKAEEDAEMPETPVSPAFPGLLEEKLAEYEALAEAELDAAQALIDAKELRDAQRALRTLARGPEAFATTDRAKQLLEEVEELLRSSRD